MTVGMVNAEVTEHSGETRGMKLALVGSGALLVLQFAAYFSTSILVLLAGALDSLSDALISGFLLVSVSWSRKPADEYHMFGHGRAQNVAALLTSTILIFVLSIEAFRESVPRLFQARTGEIPSVSLALLVTAIAIVVYALPLVDLLRGERKGAAVRTQLVAILEMEVAFAVSLGGLILLGQGHLVADPLASVIVAAVIAMSGIYVLMDNVQYLIGKSPGEQFLKTVESSAMKAKGVLGVHDIMAEYVGPNIVHAGLQIEVAVGTPIEEADLIVEDVHRRVSEETGCQYCVIRVKPATGPK